MEWNKWSRLARNRLARSLQMGVKLTTNHAFPPRDRALFPKTTNYRQRRRFAEVATMRVSSTPLLPASAFKRVTRPGFPSRGAAPLALSLQLVSFPFGLADLEL